MRLSSFESKPSPVRDISSSDDVPKRTTTVTKSRFYGARYCHAVSETKASVAINRRMALTLLLLVLLTIVSDCRVDAQSSYNNNDYGYDDDQDDSNNSGYAPKPPPVVDNLYYDYAARQEAKVGLSDTGTNLGGGGNGGIMGGWIGTGITFVTGWFAGGYYHSRSTKNKLSVKFKKEQKELYQQYYNDVYALQQQNNELINALEQYIAATQGTGQPKKASSSTGQRRIN